MDEVTKLIFRIRRCLGATGGEGPTAQQRERDLPAEQRTELTPPYLKGFGNTDQGRRDGDAGGENHPLESYPENVGFLQTLSEEQDCRDDATAVCIHVRALPRSPIRQDGWPRILRFNGCGDYQRLKVEVARILIVKEQRCCWSGGCDKNP